MAAQGLLRFEDVAKSFGATRALKGVSLDVHRGEVLALLGENGAGKSTLIKILGGLFRADSGQVLIDGEPYRHQVRGGGRSKVAFIHQDLGLVEWMTVAENIGLARGFAQVRRRAASASTGAASATARAMPWRWSAATSIPRRAFTALSRTEKSLVAIARALMVDCDFLVLDEPTASLPADEVDRLFDAMRRLKARDVGMIYVSHRLDEIFRIADRVVVMRDGLKVGEKPVAETTPAELVSLIVGRSNLELFRKAQLRPVRSGRGGGSRDAGRGSGLVRDPTGRTARPRGPPGRRPGGDRPGALRRRAASRRDPARRRGARPLVDGRGPRGGDRPRGARPGRGIGLPFAVDPREQFPQSGRCGPGPVLAALAPHGGAARDGPRRFRRV